MYTTCRLKWVDDDTEFVGTIKAFDCSDSEKKMNVFSSMDFQKTI